jgi:protein-disulfide isomerase
MTVKPLYQAISIALALLTVSPAQADRSLFRFNGLDYRESDLSIEFQQTIHELETEHHRRLEKLLEGAMLEVYFSDEAKKQNKSIDELMNLSLSAPVPSEAEVKAFFDANKERINGDFEQIKPQLERYLQNQAQEEKRTSITTELKNKYGFEVLLRTPTALPVNIDILGYPTKGKADAPVHIVEFADYQCPYCKNAAEALKKLLDEQPETIKLTYMDMPVNKSGISLLIAHGGVCADQQGHFWDYNNLAFATQAELNADTPLTLARTLKLDEKVFSECLQQAETKEKVANSKNEALRLGVTGTPAVFVNGRRVHLFDLNTDLRSAVAQAQQNTPH